MKNLLLVFSKAILITCLLINSLSAEAQLLAGKMYFSNQPFTQGSTSNNKKNFTSGDYIYGRFELDAESIQKAFRLFEPNENYKHSYFFYRVYIYYNGEEMGFNPSVKLCLLKGTARKNTWFNFDVLPEPAKASTVLCGTERFNTQISSAPLYGLIDPDNFKQNGEYKLVVKFYNESYDVWDKMEPPEKWPFLQEEFTFTFKDKDVLMLKRNEIAANEVIQKKGLK